MSLPLSQNFEGSSQDTFYFQEIYRTNTLSIAEDEGTPNSSPFMGSKTKPLPWCVLIPQDKVSNKLNPIFISENIHILGRFDFPCEHSSLISANHFRLCYEPMTGKKYIVDMSSNGLYVNGERLIKHEASSINNGDIIALRVCRTINNDIQLEFLDLTALNSDNDSYCSDFTQDVLISPRFSQTDLEPILKCYICLEMLYDPVSLYPCVHNFCSCCFSQYYKNSNLIVKCPVCRQEIEGIQWNTSLIKITEKLFKRCSNLIRSESFLSDSVSSREFIQNLIVEKTLDNYIRPSKRHCHSNSEIPSNINISQPASVTCRACSGNSQSYSINCEGPRQAHISCRLCSEYMPDQQKYNQFCCLCGGYFCNQFWDCNFPSAHLEFNKLNSFFITSFPSTWKSQDPLEEEIYNAYLNKHQWKPQELFDFCLNKFKNGDYVWEQSKLSIYGVSLNSYACKSCVTDTIFPEFSLFHRISIKSNDLSYSLGQPARPYCPDGRECLRIANDHTHCLKYDHWCLSAFASGARTNHNT